MPGYFFHYLERTAVFTPDFFIAESGKFEIDFIFFDSPQSIFFTPCLCIKFFPLFLNFKACFSVDYCASGILADTLFQPARSQILCQKSSLLPSLSIFFNSFVVCIMNSCALCSCILHNNLPAFAPFSVGNCCSWNLQGKGWSHMCIIIWSFWCALSSLELSVLCSFLFSVHSQLGIFSWDYCHVISPSNPSACSLSFPWKTIQQQNMPHMIFSCCEMLFLFILMLFNQQASFRGNYIFYMTSTAYISLPPISAPPMSLHKSQPMSLHKSHDYCSWSREREATGNVFNSSLT